MPDPNLATPPDTSAWIAGGAGTAVAETPAAVPETPPAESPTPEAPLTTPEAPPTPSAAEEIVQGLAKAGMTTEQAQALVTKATTPQPIKDALEAFLDGKPYPVPKNLTFNLKSGATTRQATLEQLQREGMLATDYQRKTQELAQQRREHQQQVAQWTARDAALKAREQWFEEQRNEMIAAQKDPKKWEEYQEVIRMRAASPAFNKLYEDAIRARESDATKDVFDNAMREQQVNDGATQAMTWIREIGAEFPGVNPERVRLVLAYALQSGQLENTQEAVRQVYEGESAYLKSGPLASELEAIKAENAALKAAKDAEAHNAATARTLQRGKAPNLAPGGGGPPAPAKLVERKPIPPDRKAIDQAVSDWSKVRDE